MKIFRNRITATVGPLALGIVAIFYVLRTTISQRVSEAEQALRALLGQDASFASVEASLWNGIGFTVKEFHMADNPLFAATPFVEAREVKLGISLWHLAGGRLVINSLTLIQPEFQIITNETGQLNLAALARRQKQLVDFPKLGASADKRTAPLSFLITRLRVVDGRVDFIDRSVVAPAELPIKRIDLDVGGLDLSARARISLTASLTEGLGRDLHIEGEVGPPARGRSWSQQPLNLEMRFDSLSVPTVARALPFLRDHIPKELDITGPMYFHAQLSGTLQQPRLTNISLKVPLFGSSEYNAMLEGSAEFTSSRDWANAAIAGKLDLNDVGLAQLQGLPLLRQILPTDFVAGGSVDIRTRFEGSWNRLRAGVLIDADQGEFRFPGWLRKPAGVATDLRAQVSRHDNSVVLHPSVLQMADTQLHVSGQLAEISNPRLSMRLRSDQILLHELRPLLALQAAHSFTGNIRCDLLLERTPGIPAGPWTAQGIVSLADVGWRHTAPDRRLEGLNGVVSFTGRSAHAQNLSFRVGSSPVQVKLDITDINRLSGHYTLQSPGLNLMEIAPGSSDAAYFKHVIASGEMTVFGNFPRIQGTLDSAEGIFHSIPYRNLRAVLTWSPSGLVLDEFSAAAFAGTVHASGNWTSVGTNAPAIRIFPVLNALNLSEVLMHFSPTLKNRFTGQMDLSGEFGAAHGGEWPLKTLKGSGAISIPNGVIRNFNLIALIFHRDGAENQNDSSRERAAPKLAAIAEREDTPVRDFKTNFTIEAERIRASAVSFTTPEYAITGSGWIAMDGAIQWRGNLTVTPEISRELRRQYTALRYFVDRNGRLAVSFRIDGKLPNVRVRPENRVLARMFHWDIGERAISERQDQKKQDWLSDSLNRLLQR
jgi:AsmA-like C-terminal region/Domain of Unknown Function (DUF748)